MRIWSLHPENLDTKGLLALWRETLLAKKVLEGQTKGYKNHPQLHRFRLARRPLDSINFYLQIVCEEAESRNYNFNRSKFEVVNSYEKINVTDGQLEFEKQHLLNKLKVRDQKKYIEVSSNVNFTIHPLFTVIEGEIEEWEKI